MKPYIKTAAGEINDIVIQQAIDSLEENCYHKRTVSHFVAFAINIIKFNNHSFHKII